MVTDTAPVDQFDRRLDELAANSVHIGMIDAEGGYRNKRVPAAKARKLAKDGYSFCSILYDWDITETPYGGGAFIDVPAFLDTTTLRRYPFAEGEAICLADYLPPYGDRSPRNQLRRLVAEAETLGYGVMSAFEFEFYLFDETPDTLRGKGFRDLNSFAKSNRTYSIQTFALYGDLLNGMERTMDTLGVGLDALHTELGPGCLEAPLACAPGMAGADNAFLFKNFAKAYFLRHGVTAAFMSKWSPDAPGQSGHLHLSLVDSATGAPVFHDPSAPHGLSAQARHFIGGLVALMPEWLALCSHTVNAYKRLVPGAWAPTYAAWGVQNRSAAIRVINDTPASTRIEFRVPSADTNPYSSLAMCLAAGLWGIRNRVEPPPPRNDDCYATVPEEHLRFPRTLLEAAERFERSAVAREVFGDAFVDSYVFQRKEEDAAFRRAITEWEIRRYLEVV